LIRTLVLLKTEYRGLHYDTIQVENGSEIETKKVDFIDHLTSQYDLPNDDDLDGAHLGIHRLQSTYKKSVQNLIEGKFNKNSLAFRPLNSKIYFFY
jgi:hypothetical protein